MSPTAVRWFAVPLGLIAFAGHLAIRLWLQPWTFHLGFGQGSAVLAAAGAATIGAVFGTFALLTGRRRPTALARRKGIALVETAPAYAGAQAVLWMWLAGAMVETERVPYRDAMRLDKHSPILSAVALIFFFGIAAAFLLIRRPRLEFDADGLTIRNLRRSTRVAWDRLAPGGPLPPSRKRPRYLKLYLDEPPLYGPFPPSIDIPLGSLHVDSTFLADTIRRYVEHPDERAELLSGA